MKNILFFLLSISIGFQSMALDKLSLNAMDCGGASQSSSQGHHDCGVEIEDTDDLEEKEFNVESSSNKASRHSLFWPSDDTLYKMPYLEKDTRPPRV